MISHGVEISIAGGVGEKVRANYTAPGGRLIYPSPPQTLTPVTFAYESHDLMTQVSHSVKSIS